MTALPLQGYRSLNLHDSLFRVINYFCNG